VKKLRVMTVVGTRPELIRLSRIIARLDLDCEHTLVHTGQNYDYELNQIFFENLRIRKPDFFLNAAGSSPAETISRVISEIDKILCEYQPDALLVLGDTNSCLSVISAKRRRIPIFHFEAGNRCYDMRVPEEINRRIVDHTSDVNMTYSSIGRESLLREGLPPDLVVNVGSPMAEVLKFYESDINQSNVLERFGLIEGQYFLLSSHREENIDSDLNFDKLINIINRLQKLYGIPLIISTHPRTRKKIDSRMVVFNSNIQSIKPLGFFDYVKLQQKAKVVLSDSGTISEESSILNFAALNLREDQERHEAMEEGSVMLVGLEFDRIVQCISILGRQGVNQDRFVRQVYDYSSLNVSEKVVRIIHSYVDYVNRVVWRKYH
jgi:UDP-N-acetylglucosamine 2-epimerase (non-hydrolysing)